MKKPLYMDIYGRISSDILSGNIAPGEKIPSKRQMQALLNVSQTTVETAYGALAAEGYIYSRAGSGYYACEIEKPAFKAPLPDEITPDEPEPSFDISLSADDTDTSVFPYSAWAKITRETLCRDARLLKRGDPAGDMELRREICSYLSEIRGVSCVPGQITVGAGMEYVTGMILQLLPIDSAFALEDPGYKSVYKRLSLAGKTIYPVPVDESGLLVGSLSKTPADIVYVTPSHQFPTGVTMPVSRRASLLRWANEKEERYIIEDDYDSEFRYSAKTVPAMQGMDESRKVIYIGTFSRALAPSIRIAYAVLPPALLKKYKELSGDLSSTVSRFEQQTLAAFMDRGLYTRHLRRAGNLYRQKQDLFRSVLSKTPGLRVSGAEAGLHFLVTVEGKSESELKRAAEKEGIRVLGLSDFRCRKSAEDEKRGTLIIGFTGLSLEKIENCAETLRRVWSGL